MQNPEEHYLEQMMKKHDEMVKLQGRVFDIACRKLGLDAHTVTFDSKKDVSTEADKIATNFYYNDMVVKKSYMGCESLDMTFFFDAQGDACYSYAGYTDGRDTVEKLVAAFEKAEQLRTAMDEVMTDLMHRQIGQHIVIDGKNCIKSDEWEKEETYTVGQFVDDKQFFYAEVNGTVLEYDHNPDREEIEEDYLNEMAERDIDSHEAEVFEELGL
jgi:hypothetical protein